MSLTCSLPMKYHNSSICRQSGRRLKTCYNVNRSQKVGLPVFLSIEQFSDCIDFIELLSSWVNMKYSIAHSWAPPLDGSHVNRVNVKGVFSMLSLVLVNEKVPTHFLHGAQLVFLCLNTQQHQKEQEILRQVTLPWPTETQISQITAKLAIWCTKKEQQH